MKTPSISELQPDSELFDLQRFSVLVEQAPSPIIAVKKAIQVADSILTERFRQQSDIKLIIKQRAWVIDQLLTWLWQQLECSHSKDIALLAVGGYGRAELHPQSDIDLLILLREDDLEPFACDLEGFITQLWDIGFEVGHAVRSLSECATLAKDDITIATNLMEARTICGAPELCEMMLEATGPEHVWPVDEFFSAKWTEQIARYRKYDDTEQSLEPDVKSAPGALRDIQTIGWVTKRYFKANRLSELVTHHFLTADEYSTLDAAQQFLWEVRFALHVITKRSENRLLFDYQRSVAELLGYRDSDTNLAVEKFMKRYYRVVLAVSQLNDMLLRHFDETIIKIREIDQVIPYNKRFQIHNDYIEASHDEVFKQTPSALLEIFVILAQNEHIQGIRASTIRLIKDDKQLIDTTFRNDIRNTALFIQLLRSPHRLYTQLSRMKRYGILGNYIPQFGRVIGQMQYDLFHIYTVDAHTLHVLRNMRRFRYRDAKREFPVAAYIFHRLPKIELLYIAGLFHDVGKGKGCDHSTAGAIDAENFCSHHRLSKWDTQLVSWLVKNHLLMSLTSQKKDVSDPEVIHSFATAVGDQIHLDYLYALTVADICATNPSLWNGWRSSLLRQLYTEARRALRRGLEKTVNKLDWILETKERASSILSTKNIDTTQTQALWQQFGDDYFLRESPSGVARHTEAILKHDTTLGPLVVVCKTEESHFERSAQIFIYTEDKPNLFAVSVTALDQLNLSIADAKVMTSAEDISLDTYVVMDENGQTLGDDPARIAQIEDKLRTAIINLDQYNSTTNKRMPRALKHFQIPTEVVITNNPEHQHTTIEVISLDRPGMLAEIGGIFAELSIELQSARIATLGERVEDVFYVTTLEGGAITDPFLCEKIEHTIKFKLDENT
ncbi:[protein-PII] uridylyltransferase [Gammaproteobacteria bacterium 45_16_T64]|nr:[protein-PII] uridylyltransferase [Gammaproteobacteria bacterium 45_16_T64]